jgi:hypothetical protein
MALIQIQIIKDRIKIESHGEQDSCAVVSAIVQAYKNITGEEIIQRNGYTETPFHAGLVLTLQQAANSYPNSVKLTVKSLPEPEEEIDECQALADKEHQESLIAIEKAVKAKKAKAKKAKAKKELVEAIEEVAAELEETPTED